MFKHLAIVATALVALLVPTAAHAASAKSKVRFSATSFAVAENAGTATISVTRSARNGKSKSATGTVVTVGYSTSNGTATAGGDYTPASGRLTFPACGSSPGASDPCLVQTFNVPIIDNGVVGSSNKTVKLALTSPSRNSVVVNPQKATLTIADNEGPSRVSFDAPDYHAWELGPQVEVHVIRSGLGISGSSSVDFSTADGTATAPGDYTSKSTTLSYAAGEVDKTVMVDIADDGTAESTESFNVQLSNASAGTAIDTPSAPVTILDDDTPTPAHVGFEVSTYSLGEGGDVTITVNRTANIDTAVSVDYATLAQGATADVDFTAVADTLDFDPGDTSQSFTIPTVGDSLHEGDETFEVKLGNALPGGTVVDTGTTTVTIVDDDPLPVVSTGDSSTGNGTVTFPVNLSNPSTTDVTVVYVITDGNGNTVATGTVTIPAGETGTTVTIPVSGTGPWTVVISDPTGGTIDPVPGGGSTTTPLPSDPGTPGGSGGTGGAGDTGGTGGSAGFNPDSTGQGTGGSTSSGTDTTVTVTSGPSQTLAAAAPSVCRLTVKAASRVDRRKGLVVKLRAGRACTVTLGASVKGTGGKRTNSTRVLRALKTKRQSVTLAKGQTKTVKLRFSKRALGFITRALNARRGMTLTLAVIERDGAKRVTKRTTRTTLRR